MIARGFRSVIWVATVGGAALSCYMVSLRVATERNELARVERQIVEAKRDIRSLQTELGTRGRMTQLEQWNAEVLALAAPSSAQFLKDEFTLARLYRNDPTVADRSAELRLASAATGAAQPGEGAKPVMPPAVQAVAEAPEPQPPMVHRASFTTAEAQAKPKPASEAPARPKPAVAKADKPKDERTASAATATPESGGSKPSAKLAAPAMVKPEATPSRPAAKPAARPNAVRTAAAVKPARESAAAPGSAKGAKVTAKEGGGN